MRTRRACADHVLGDIHRHELLAVVDRDGVPHHLREDGGAARPGLDDLFVVRLVLLFDFLEQMTVDERSLGG